MQDVQNPTNPALQNAYELAKSQGYSKDINAFKSLISTNDEALNRIYSSVQEKGYSKDIESFKTLLNLKKKDSSTSTDQKLDSVQKVEPGSSAISPSKILNNRPDELNLRDSQSTATKTPRIKPIGYTSVDAIPNIEYKDLNPTEQIVADRKAKAFELFEKYHDLYKDTVAHTDEDNNEVKSRLKAEKNYSGWERFKDGALTFVKRSIGLPSSVAKTKTIPFEDELKEVKLDAIKSNENLDPDTIKKRAEERFIAKQKDFIYNDKAVRFLEDLPEDAKDVIQFKLSWDIDNLTSENATLINANKAIELKLQQGLKEIETFEAMFRDDPESLTEDRINEYNTLRQDLIEQAQIGERNTEQLITNDTDLQTSEREHDLFRRSYDYTFLNNFALTSTDLVLGGADFINYLSKLSALNNGHTNTEPVFETKAVRKTVEKDRNDLRPAVESVESLNGFLNYTSDLVANQLPILAITPTGYGGLTTLGAITTGQKYAEMNDKILDGKANYNPLQMMAVPLGHGTAEAIFEIPTLSILKKGRRVLSSAAKESGSLFQKTAKQKFAEMSKDFSKELASEQATNLVQNGLNIYALGKEGNITDNALDVLKDSALLTLLMQGTPHMASRALKPFQAKDNLKALEVNADKMKALYAELENKDLAESETDILTKEIDRLNSESSSIMQTLIGDVSQMPEELHKEIIGLNEEAGQLRAQAQDIYVNGKSDNKEALLKLVESKHKEVQDKRENLINEFKNNQNTFEAKKATEKAKETEKPKVETTETKTEVHNTEGIVDTPSPTVELNPINTNETQTEGNLVTDGDIRSDVAKREQQESNKDTQSPVDTNSSQKPIEIRLGATDKSKLYSVVKNEQGQLEVLDSEGNIEKSTYKDENGKTKKGRRNDVLYAYADQIDLTEGDKYKVPEGVTIQESGNIDKEVANNSKNPFELAELALRTANKNYIEENIDPADEIILNYINGNVKRGDKNSKGNDGSFINQDDASSIGVSIGKTYLRKDGRGLDVLAKELSDEDMVGREVTEQEIIDLMKAYPNGVNDLYKSVRDITSNPAKSNFTAITGLPASDRFLLKAIEQQNKKDKLNEKLEKDYLNNLTEEELISLHNEQQEFQTFERQNDTSNAKADAKGNIVEGEKKSRVREGTDKSDGNKEQASQARVKSLTNERIKPARIKPKSTPKKLSTIVSDVSKALKATLVYGKSSRKNILGTYNPTNTLVKIRNANDLDTVSHELGHLLDDRHNILGQVSGHKNEIQIVNQLKWFSNRGGSNPPKGLSASKKATYLEREGLAEFIRAYVINPKVSQSMAPELHQLFESAIDSKTKSVLKDFSQDILDFENASYIDKTLSNIEDRNKSKTISVQEWFSQFKTSDGKLNIHFLDQVKSKWTNSLHTANKAFRFGMDIKGVDSKTLKPEVNFEIISRLLAGVNGKINSLLNNGLVNAKNQKLKDSKGNYMTVDYLLEPLDNSSESSLNSEMNLALAYLVSQRTIEYSKKLGRNDNLTGTSGGLNETDVEIALGALDEVKQLKRTNKEKYDRIIEGARRYREFADAGLKYALDKGRISQEQYDRIKETNEFYVSLARTKELKPDEELLPFLNESNKITSVKDVIKKSTGGTDTIKDPYLSLLQNTVNFVKESDRNEVMNSFVEPFRGTRDMGDGVPIDLAQVASLSKSGEPNTKKVYNNGKEEYWQFDQDVYESLTGLESIAHNPIIKALGAPADLIRFTVTNFPVFAARNAMRDSVARLVVSRTNGKITDLIHNKEDRQFFELYGGSQAGFYLQNKDAYVDQLNTAIKDMTKKDGIILDPRKMSYKGYRKFLERGENLNRIAEYKSAYKKAKKDGMDDYNAGLYAAFQARDLMDFAVAGHYMRTINKLVPFSNAAIQSIKRNVKGAKENPGQFALRMALYTVLPQLAFRGLVEAMGDDEEYEELPDYQRDLFWNFKTPMTGDKWISIPKPFELGLPSSFMDRAISNAKGNDEAFDGFAYSSYNTLNPFDVLSLATGAKPLIEAGLNRDTFRDRDIVPFWEADKLLELRDGTKYASRIGNGLSDAFGFVGAEVDPRKIDHVIKGYTTYFGDTVLSLGDISKEDSRNQFDFTNTGFMKGVPISNAKSVKKAIDLAKDIGAESDKNVKYLKGMVKAYYDLEDKTQKKDLSKLIYRYSKEVLIPYLEAKKTVKLTNATAE